MKKQPMITERTRQNFVDAFWSLAEERPLNRITVGAVTNRAGYNRSTFYEYFPDMPALLKFVEQDILEQCRRNIRKIAPQIQAGSDSSLFAPVFSDMNEKMYRLLGPEGDPGFFLQLKDELIPPMVDTLRLPRDLPHFDYVLSFAYSAAIGLLQYWHQKEKDLSTDEIYHLVHTLMFTGIQGYLRDGETAMPENGSPAAP